MENFCVPKPGKTKPQPQPNGWGCGFWLVHIGKQARAGVSDKPGRGLRMLFAHQGAGVLGRRRHSAAAGAAASLRASNFAISAGEVRMAASMRASTASEQTETATKAGT